MIKTWNMHEAMQQFPYSILCMFLISIQTWGKERYGPWPSQKGILYIL